jgi:hypothetical protein
LHHDYDATARRRVTYGLDPNSRHEPPMRARGVRAGA